MPPANAAWLSFRSRASVCLSVCLSDLVLTYESTDLETSFSVYMHPFRISRSSSYIEVIGSRSRSLEQTLLNAFAGDLPSIKWRSCIYSHVIFTELNFIHFNVALSDVVMSCECCSVEAYLDQRADV